MLATLLKGASAGPRGIEFIAGAQTQNSGNDTTLVINKPAGTQQGDLMVMVGAASGSASWSGDTGWTSLVNSTSSLGFTVIYKVAGASEPGSYTFTTGTSRRLSGGILTYRNADYDAVGAVGSSSDTNVINAPSVTVANNSSVLLGFAAFTASGRTGGAPSPMVTRLLDNDATAPSWITADEPVDAGATGTRTFSFSGSSGLNDIKAVLLALKPA
jgi:hypothetical protein